MKVQIKQRPGGVFCHSLLRKTIEYTIFHLLNPSEYEDMVVIVSVKEKPGLTKNVMGTCVPDIILDFVKRKTKIELNNKFFITIGKHLSKADQVSTMIHELVHLKQYARGELKATVDGFRWNGRKPYPYKNYERSPWEKEAFFLEEEILAEFINDHYEDVEIQQILKLELLK
jgi:hypothetical protein